MTTKAIRAIYNTNLGIKQDESVLVFTDRPSPAEILTDIERCRRERLRDIALLTSEIGKTFTKKILRMEYAATGNHGAEPPEDLWKIAFGEKTLGELKKANLLSPDSCSPLPQSRSVEERQRQTNAGGLEWLLSRALLAQEQVAVLWQKYLQPVSPNPPGQ